MAPDGGAVERRLWDERRDRDLGVDGCQEKINRLGENRLNLASPITLVSVASILVS